MKLIKDMTGCSGGDIYPRVHAKGEDCPADLIAAAIALGALDKKDVNKARDEAAVAARLAAEEEAARLATEGGQG